MPYFNHFISHKIPHIFAWLSHSIFPPINRVPFTGEIFSCQDPILSADAFCSFWKA